MIGVLMCERAMERPIAGLCFVAFNEWVKRCDQLGNLDDIYGEVNRFSADIGLHNVFFYSFP